MTCNRCSKIKVGRTRQFSSAQAVIISVPVKDLERGMMIVSHNPNERLYCSFCDNKHPSLVLEAPKRVVRFYGPKLRSEMMNVVCVPHPLQLSPYGEVDVLEQSVGRSALESSIRDE